MRVELKRSRPVSNTEVCSQLVSYPRKITAISPEQTKRLAGNLAFDLVGNPFPEFRTGREGIIKVGAIARDCDRVCRNQTVLSKKKEPPRLLLSNRG